MKIKAHPKIKCVVTKSLSQLTLAFKRHDTQYSWDSLIKIAADDSLSVIKQQFFFFQTAADAVSHTDRKLGSYWRWLTWLLWMEMAQASLRGSCWRLRWIPPPDLNTQRSGFSTSVTPHRKRTRGCPGVGKQRKKEFAY